MQSQLLEALRRIISASHSNAGARLPASRALAAELSVSRTTVQAAYDQLISEGYLTTRQGSGTFVTRQITHLLPPPARATTNTAHGEAWLPFQAGLPDQDLLPHGQWTRHLERAWRAPDPALLGRADPLGWYPLRVAVSDHLAAWRHLDCDPEQVVITSGAWESFEIVFRGLLPAAQTVAVEDPCWAKTRDLLAMSGAKAHPIRIDEDGFDAARIPADVTATIVTPSRHYPTGCNLPLSRRLALLDWATKSGGIIVEDDYDSEFRYQGHPLPSLTGLDGLQHSVYLGSFSKLISPALRIGYMVLPRHCLTPAREFIQQVGTRASLVPQPALATFMQSGDFAVHLRRMRRIYARRQSHLINVLQPVQTLLDIRPDTSGMHLCVPLRPGLKRLLSDQDICKIAHRAGLHVGALSAHSVLPDKPHALLLGYAAFDEEVLSEAGARLCNVIRQAS